MKSLYIADASNWIYKFKSVYKFAHISVGGVDVDTSVPFGFYRALHENMATDIAIVLDGLPSRSLSVLPGYKGQRNKAEISTLSVPKLEVVHFLTQLGTLLGKQIHVICSPLQETDEVISSLVHAITGNLPQRASFISCLNTHPIEDDPMLKYLSGCTLELFDYSQYDSVIIGSTDGDFIQLQRFPGVYIDTSCSGKCISDVRSSKSTSGTTPIASIAYKAICGDVSDNIPSVGLHLKTDQIVSIVNLIDSEETLRSFYRGCVVGSTTLEGPLAELARLVYMNNARQFSTNWTVAYLDFVSFPRAITFNDSVYDIHDTLTKYKIKVR